MADRLLRIKDIQAVLNLSTSTIFRLLRTHQLPGFQVGHTWFCAESKLYKALDMEPPKEKEKEYARAN